MALIRGIFGGTFDPPHVGHLLLAERVSEALTLDQLLWMPVAQSPFKQGKATSSVAHRMAMIAAAIGDNPRFAVSDLDTRGKAPHYTVDLLRTLHALWPDDNLVFVMGGDMLNSFDRWHQPDEILDLATIAAVPRPGEPLDVARLGDALPTLPARLTIIPMPLIDISSTDIRKRVAEGQSVRYMLPNAVGQYIRDTGLYR